MIDIQEVSKIKEYQRDFEERFGKRLEIDWDTMKGSRKCSITFRHFKEQDFKTDDDGSPLLESNEKSALEMLIKQ